MSNNPTNIFSFKGTTRIGSVSGRIDSSSSSSDSSGSSSSSDW